MTKVLDDYEKSENQSAEMEEDNKALGALIFTGSFLAYYSSITKS